MKSQSKWIRNRVMMTARVKSFLKIVEKQRSMVVTIIIDPRASLSCKKITIQRREDLLSNCLKFRWALVVRLTWNLTRCRTMEWLQCSSVAWPFTNCRLSIYASRLKCSSPTSRWILNRLSSTAENLGRSTSSENSGLASWWDSTSYSCTFMQRLSHCT